MDFHALQTLRTVEASGGTQLFGQYTVLPGWIRIRTCLCVQDSPDNPCPCGSIWVDSKGQTVFPPFAWIRTNDIIQIQEDLRKSFDGGSIAKIVVRADTQIICEMQEPMKASDFEQRAASIIRSPIIQRPPVGRVPLGNIFVGDIVLASSPAVKGMPKAVFGQSNLTRGESVIELRGSIAGLTDDVPLMFSLEIVDDFIRDVEDALEKAIDTGMDELTIDINGEGPVTLSNPTALSMDGQTTLRLETSVEAGKTVLAWEGPGKLIPGNSVILAKGFPAIGGLISKVGDLLGAAVAVVCVVFAGDIQNCLTKGTNACGAGNVKQINARAKLSKEGCSVVCNVTCK